MNDDTALCTRQGGVDRSLLVDPLRLILTLSLLLLQLLLSAAGRLAAQLPLFAFEGGGGRGGGYGVAEQPLGDADGGGQGIPLLVPRVVDGRARASRLRRDRAVAVSVPQGERGRHQHAHQVGPLTTTEKS